MGWFSKSFQQAAKSFNKTLSDTAEAAADVGKKAAETAKKAADNAKKEIQEAKKEAAEKKQPIPLSVLAAVMTAPPLPPKHFAVTDLRAKLTVTAITELSDDEHEIHITATNVGMSTWEGEKQVKLKPVLATDADEFLIAGFTSSKKKLHQKKEWVELPSSLSIPSGKDHTFKFIVKTPPKPKKTESTSKPSIGPTSTPGFGDAGIGASAGATGGGLYDSSTTTTSTTKIPMLNFYLEWVSEQITFTDSEFKDFQLKTTDPKLAEQLHKMEVESTKKQQTLADVGVDSASGLGMAKAKEADYKSLLEKIPEVAPKVQEVANAIATLKAKKLNAQAKLKQFTATSAYDYFFDENNYISSTGFPDLNKADKFRLMINRLWSVADDSKEENFTTSFSYGSPKFSVSLTASHKAWKDSKTSQDFKSYHLSKLLKNPAYKNFPIAQLFHFVIIDAISSTAKLSIEPDTTKEWSEKIEEKGFYTPCEETYHCSKGEKCEKETGKCKSIRGHGYQSVRIDFEKKYGKKFGPGHAVYDAIEEFADSNYEHFTLDYIKDIVAGLENDIGNGKEFEDHSFRIRSYSREEQNSKLHFNVITDYNFSTEESLNVAMDKHERSLPFAYSGSVMPKPENLGYNTSLKDQPTLKTVLFDRTILATRNTELFKEYGKDPYQIKITLPAVTEFSKESVVTSRDTEVVTRKFVNLLQDDKTPSKTMFRAGPGFNNLESYKNADISTFEKLPVDVKTPHAVGGEVSSYPKEINAKTSLTDQELTYADIINGKLSKVEMIGYKITKHKQQEPVQTFYVPYEQNNSPIKLMDSQIKYGEEYTYTPSALMLINGLKYQYDYDIQVTENDIVVPATPPDLSIKDVKKQVTNKCIAEMSSFASTPTKAACTKILKCDKSDTECLLGQIPQILTDYKKCNYKGCYKSATIPTATKKKVFAEEVLESVFQQEPKFDGMVPGLAYRVKSKPDLKMIEVPLLGNGEEMSHRVMVEPPMPPITTINPYYGVSNKLLFLLEKGIGAVKLAITHPESNWEKIKASQISSDSRLGDAKIKRTNLKENEFIFTGIGKIDTFLVYRLENEPTSLNDFIAPGPHAVIDIADSFLIDDVEPNKKYYYVTKAINVHGDISYMSDILRAELVDEGGVVFPVIEPYKIPKIDNTSTSMQFKKALRIRPAFLQKAPNKKLKDLGFEKESVFNDRNLFKFRITSNKTKRKIDVNVKFKKKTIQEALSTPPNKGDKILEWREAESTFTPVIQIKPDFSLISSLGSIPLATCKVDSECIMSGYKCKYGKCIKDRRARLQEIGVAGTAEEIKEKGFYTPCEKDFQCPSGEKCYSGKCMKSGPDVKVDELGFIKVIPQEPSKGLLTNSEKTNLDNKAKSFFSTQPSGFKVWVDTYTQETITETAKILTKKSLQMGKLFELTKCEQLPVDLIKENKTIISNLYLLQKMKEINTARAHPNIIFYKNGYDYTFKESDNKLICLRQMIGEL